MDAGNLGEVVTGEGLVGFRLILEVSIDLKRHAQEAAWGRFSGC